MRTTESLEDDTDDADSETDTEEHEASNLPPGQVRVSEKIKMYPNEVRNLFIEEIAPSETNTLIYRPVRFDDPAIVELARSIRVHGLLEPLIVTEDYRIMSGHRRYAAARLACMMMIPCRIFPMKSNDPRLAELLTICNQQRVKTLDEFMREIIATANPEDAYQALIEHRAERAETNHNLERIQLRDYKARDKISAAKRPMLDAVRRILEENREYWPLSDRQIITGYFLFPSCGTLPNPTACIAIPCSVTRM